MNRYLILGIALAFAAGGAQAQLSAAVDMTRAVKVEGAVVKVMWVDSSTEITVRGADGQTQVVNTANVATLLEAGGGREYMRPGTPVSINGFAAADGSRVYADPAQITSNGNSLFPKAAPNPDIPRMVSQVVTTCGSAQAPIDASQSRGDEDNGAAAITSWQSECDTRLAARGVRLGAPIIRSFTTNSVIREGAR